MVKSETVLGKWIERIPAPSSWKFWLGLAALIKGCYFLIEYGEGYIPEVEGGIGAAHPDTGSYLDPIDHLVAEGTYDPDFRMPGYGALYLPLRLLFGADTGKDMLVILQLVLDILGTYFLALAAWMLSRNVLAFLITFGLYGLASTLSGFNLFMLTESPCASLLCFVALLVASHFRTASLWALVGASTMLTWAYFFRPVMLPYVPLLLLSAAWVARREKRRLWPVVLAVCIPVVIIQGAWTARNQMVHGRWQVLTASKYYPDSYLSGIAGFHLAGQFDDAAAFYFFPDVEWTDRQEPLFDVRQVPFPPWLEADPVLRDSLYALRDAGFEMVAHPEGSLERLRADTALAPRFMAMAALVQERHPWQARVMTPLRLTVKHVFKSSGVRNLFLTPFRFLPVWAKGIKLAHIAIFLCALYGSLLFICWSVLSRQGRSYVVLALCLIYAMLVHPVVFRFVDVRYLYVSYPIIALAAGIFLASMLGRFSAFGQKAGKQVVQGHSAT